MDAQLLLRTLRAVRMAHGPNSQLANLSNTRTMFLEIASGLQKHLVRV